MSKMYTMLTVLPVLLAATLVIGCSKSADAAAGKSSGEANAPQVGPQDTKKADAVPDKVVVYYFHGNRRCPTCLGIQRSIEETIDEVFKQEIANGELVFEEINYEENANKHFVQKYELSFSTMIVATLAGDETVKWENADKVWEHAHEPPALKKYVEQSVRTYLKMLRAK